MILAHRHRWLYWYRACALPDATRAPVLPGSTPDFTGKAGSIMTIHYGGPNASIKIFGDISEDDLRGFDALFIWRSYPTILSVNIILNSPMLSTISEL